MEVYYFKMMKTGLVSNDPKNDENRIGQQRSQ
jgi:hypothetical protein